MLSATDVHFEMADRMFWHSTMVASVPCRLTGQKLGLDERSLMCGCKLLKRHLRLSRGSDHVSTLAYNANCRMACGLADIELRRNDQALLRSDLELSAFLSLTTSGDFTRRFDFKTLFLALMDASSDSRSTGLSMNSLGRPSVARLY